MQHLLGITVISLIILEQVHTENGIREHQGPQTCGGRLKGPQGIIQTPNFPHAFSVPIKCRWIIEHDLTNGTISIYFTQQYTTVGLTFTEYMYYDDSYKLGERRALTLTEENITRVKWLQVQSRVLVVELSLSRLEGSQLRALGLLSVFGFNVTYAVRGAGDAAAPAPVSCSAIECRLLGHCYAARDYQRFFCSCFEGYSGADCGVGPLCPATSNMCRNGGTCRQMGPAAVSCMCPPGYTGDLCEARVGDPECGIEECSDGCKGGLKCDCSPKDNDAASARFETRLQIMDNTSANITQEISSLVEYYIKMSNVTIEDEIEILNVSASDTTGTRSVWVRIWCLRRDASAVKAALARLAASRPLPLLPAVIDVHMQPSLSLHPLAINQRPEVWEGSEFIISCMAYGSSDMTFTWYKDGDKVNFNGTTRDMWTRTVAEDGLGRRMSVVGVSEAKRIDSGRWSCAANDAGRRRCRALWLTVLAPPDVTLIPSTLTVNKGDNVTITCLAGAGRVHGVLGFSWSRDRTLLRLAPGREVWEDLYPAGSVLRLFNVNKSGEYRCQVSSLAGTNAAGVVMWALGSNDEACDAEPFHSPRWLRTAAGAYATASCPPGQSGEASRYCEPKIGQQGVKWREPDFAKCIADPLKDIYEQFTLISYGYSHQSFVALVKQYSSVLRGVMEAGPSSGSIPLSHAREMLRYLMSIHAGVSHSETIETVNHLLDIYDTLLKNSEAFQDEMKIIELQNAIAETASLTDNLKRPLQELSVQTHSVALYVSVQLRGQVAVSDEWLLTAAGVQLMASTGPARFTIVQYYHLHKRLPSLMRFVEFKNGREMEYRLASQHIQLSLSGIDVDPTHSHTVTLLFKQTHNYSSIAPKPACGVRKPTEPRLWIMEACEVKVPEPSHVSCRCSGLGTFALFTVAKSPMTDSERQLRGAVKVSVSVGGAMCLLSAALQMFGLIPNRQPRLPRSLKVLTAAAHAAAMFTLLDLDIRQLTACGGWLEWVVAMSWCAGCAALCAQPLLLHAELAGHKHGAPSVSLLAGVCLLTWLTARLWGGEPLKLGTPAQIVCFGTCALLSALCLALTICAAVKLKNIARKVPAERKNYLKDRRRTISHTLMLLATTSFTQAAGMMYAQPHSDAQNTAQDSAFCVAALANGIAMLVCYVLYDEVCLRSAQQALTVGAQRTWDTPEGHTSLSCEEIESRGGAVASSSSQESPITSYWRAPGLESPAPRTYRRQSTPDSRADIVRCVEYRASVLSPHRYESHRVTTTRALCDLIPRTPPQQEYMPYTCMELGVSTNPQQNASPASLTCSLDFQPYTLKPFETLKENCSLCVQSNPDVSKNQPLQIKSCLKKTNKSFTSSISLPSMETVDSEKKSTDIEKVNKEWNKAYNSPSTDKMLNKISNDLDFLLNRTLEPGVKVVDEIEKAPT